ncbi:MAG: hypothetical protein HKP27_06940 [Myxococcales bacterium]|nr:hypothetical protein [Myxococcales bacterium]
MRGIFLSANRNKRSLCVDLKKPEGLRVVERLAERADVFVQNFRPGAIERMGLGEERVRALSPRVVYVSISGFGESGPFAHQRVYDPVIQALSGLADIQADPETRRPRMMRTIIPDKTTALTAAQVPAAPVLRREELLTHPQIVANELLEVHRDERAGDVRQPRPAARFEATPASVRRLAPRLGEDDEEVLAEIGYGDSEIVALRAAGVIRDRGPN